jgi:hypothetical protein
MWYLRRIVQCETIIHCASFHCECIQVRLNTRAGWNCLLEDGAGALIHSGAGWWIIVTHCWNIIQPLENRGRTAWWRYWNNCVAIRCLGREPFTRSLTLFLSILVINNNFWRSNFNFCKLHASLSTLHHKHRSLPNLELWEKKGEENGENYTPHQILLRW